MFTFLDTNGDDYLDTGELEALFVKEVSVIYKPDAYMCCKIADGIAVRRNSWSSCHVVIFQN